MGDYSYPLPFQESYWWGVLIPRVLPWAKETETLSGFRCSDTICITTLLDCLGYAATWFWWNLLCSDLILMGFVLAHCHGLTHGEGLLVGGQEFVVTLGQCFG